MNSGTTTVADTGGTGEVLHVSRRDRWASTIAAIFTAIHGAAGLWAFGWTYFVVPRQKQQLDDGTEISDLTVLLIQLSDLVVNYWYLLLIPAVLALVCDFILIRWIVKQCGIILAVLFGVCIAMILVVQLIFGQMVLQAEYFRRDLSDLTTYATLNHPAHWKPSS